MPASEDLSRTISPHQQNNLQEQNQHQTQHEQVEPQNSPYFTSQPLISSPPEVSGNSFGGIAAQLSTVPGVGSGVGGNFRHRIYPKELASNSLLKNAANSSASPLRSTFSNPADLFSRSIPSFLSSSPGTGSSPQSSVAGSPPSSWPASYTNNTFISRGIGGSVPQQRGNGTYPSFEEQLSRNGGFLPYPRAGFTFGGVESEKRLSPGESGYFCSFDTLDSESENVVCMGWDGGLDVWKVGKGMLDLLGRLEGLSGTVRDAKILPAPQRSDPLAPIRPLIVLTLHSPIYGSQEESASPVPSPPTSRPHSATSYSSTGFHHSNHTPPRKKSSADLEWQTSVEIYSIFTKKRVAILFTSPLVSNFPITHLDTQSPFPLWSSIKVEVGVNSVAVGLGLSGEVYLFSLVNSSDSTSTAHSNIAESTRITDTKKGKEANFKNVQGTQETSKETMGGTPREETITGQWVCQAKVWTTVQVPSHASDNNAFSHGLGNHGIGFHKNGIAVFSLRGRWLAYVPPPANSSVSAGGIIQVPLGFSSGSVLSQTPPSPPSVSATVDMADGEEKLLNRLTREGIQEGIRVAKWVGEHGMRAIQNYWSSNSNAQGGFGTPPPLSSFPEQNPGNGAGQHAGTGSHTISRGPPGGISGLAQQIQREKQLKQFSGYSGPVGSSSASGNTNPGLLTYSNFISNSGNASNGSQGHSPPYQSGGYLRSAMHGANDLVLVSLLDIAKFPNFKDVSQNNTMPWGHQLSPFATFQPPLGVSYLSLSPSGLALLTASSKGDVYHVWDLLGVVHQRTGNASSMTTKGNMNGTSFGTVSNRYVRQIARFSRLTVAHTVDAVWSYPRGDKFAILTDKGTVHFYDLPSNAYQWPPFKKPPPTSTRSSTVFNAQQQATGAVHAVQGAMGLLNSTAQPLLTAAIRKSSNSGLVGKGNSPTGGINVDYNKYKHKAIKNGGGNADNRAKVQNVPMGIIKISLPGPTVAVTPGTVKFLMGKERGHVAMIGGGVLMVYQKTSGGQGGSKKKRSRGVGGIIPDTGLMYELPALPGAAVSALSGKEPSAEVEKVVRGFWNAKHHYNHGSHRRQNSHVFLGDYYRKKEGQQQYEMHPLAFAEIDTNPDYVALHEDRRVTLMVFAEPDAVAAPIASSVLPHATTQKPVVPPLWDTQRTDLPVEKSQKWVFGLPIQVEKLNLGGGKGDVEFCEDSALEDVLDAMESKLRLDHEVGGEYLPAETGRKKRGKVKNVGYDGEGIFEDDCEVLDYHL